MTLSQAPLFSVSNLKVRAGDKEVLHGIDLRVKAGEVHAIMGRNGSGKTTLASTLMGHPAYTVTEGSVTLNGENLLDLAPEERAKRGLFLGFQYPVAISGVSVGNFLRTSLKSLGQEGGPGEIRKRIKAEAAALGIPDAFLGRSLNEGFSGGEKKKMETLQMRLMKPRVAVLDETDSGLDIDALRTVAASINSFRDSQRSFILITHYQRLLEAIVPDHVHVLLKGRIVKSGGPELALELEKEGYEAFVKEESL